MIRVGLEVGSGETVSVVFWMVEFRDEERVMEDPKLMKVPDPKRCPCLHFYTVEYSLESGNATQKTKGTNKKGTRKG